MADLHSEGGTDSADLSESDFGVNGIVDGVIYFEGVPESWATRKSKWLPGVEEMLGSYVYLLIDPRLNGTDSIFYVGKGVGGRCFSHVAEAHKTIADQRGDYEKLRTIREIEEQGFHVQIDILRHGLTEREAFVVEASIIDIVPGTNRVVGHDVALGRRTVMNINSMYGAPPINIEPDERIMLVRVARAFTERMTDEELFEITAGFWRIGTVRRKAGSPRSPQIALAIHRGVVRAVYKITGWRQATDEEARIDPTRVGRWAFTGQRDTSAEDRYMLTSVAAYLADNAQNPISYVNCR